jgi:NADH-quinone oxidoreductase subunit J
MAVFVISSAVALISTILVITRRNPVHALLYLILSLLAVAVLFYSIGESLAAAFELIVYAGAIMVLFVFVVMLLNPGALAAGGQRRRPLFWLVPVLLGLVLLGELVYVFTRLPPRPLAAGAVSPQQVGLALFGPYLLGVELASFLLLAGLIGAYHIGRRKPS